MSSQQVHTAAPQASNNGTPPENGTPLNNDDASTCAVSGPNNRDAAPDEQQTQPSVTDSTSNSNQDEHTKIEKPVPYTEFSKGRPANVAYSELEKIPNPYRWPAIVLNCGLTFNGVACKMAPVSDDPVTRVKTIRAMPMREDDIFLLAFPKCGTHWLSLMIDMLMKGSPELKIARKRGVMLEFWDNLAVLNDDPSPRFINSHLAINHLPEELVERKVKIVHIYRNMKDQTVSFYHHIKQFFNPEEENLSFDNFIKGHLTDGYPSYGNQWDYLKQLWEFERSNPSHPIKHVSYEALQKDALPILLEVSQFLGIPASELFCREVIKACSIEKVKALSDSTRPPGNLSLFRKGVVGDWKNHFTVAQSEMFDEFFREKEHKSTGFSLKYFEGLDIS